MSGILYKDIRLSPNVLAFLKIIFTVKADGSLQLSDPAFATHIEESLAAVFLDKAGDAHLNKFNEFPYVDILKRLSKAGVVPVATNFSNLADFLEHPTVTGGFKLEIESLAINFITTCLMHGYGKYPSAFDFGFAFQSLLNLGKGKPQIMQFNGALFEESAASLPTFLHGVLEVADAASLFGGLRLDPDSELSKLQQPVPSAPKGSRSASWGDFRPSSPPPLKAAAAPAPAPTVSKLPLLRLTDKKPTQVLTPIAGSPGEGGIRLGEPTVAAATSALERLNVRAQTPYSQTGAVLVLPSAARQPVLSLPVAMCSSNPVAQVQKPGAVKAKKKRKPQVSFDPHSPKALAAPQLKPKPSPISDIESFELSVTSLPSAPADYPPPLRSNKVRRSMGARYVSSLVAKRGSLSRPFAEKSPVGSMSPTTTAVACMPPVALLALPATNRHSKGWPMMLPPPLPSARRDRSNTRVSLSPPVSSTPFNNLLEQLVVDGFEPDLSTMTPDLLL